MEFLEGRDNRDLHVISSFYPDFYRELSRVMGSPAGGCLVEHKLHLVSHPRRSGRGMCTPVTHWPCLEWKRPRHFPVRVKSLIWKGQVPFCWGVALCLVGCWAASLDQRQNFEAPVCLPPCTPHPQPHTSALAWTVSGGVALLFFNGWSWFRRWASVAARPLAGWPGAGLSHGAGLPVAVASCPEAWVPGPGLQSPGMVSAASWNVGSFPNQGWSLCSLHWQVDS